MHVPSLTQRPAKRGFSLVELLVTIGIIGVLSALAIPLAGTVHKKSQIAASTSNLRQLGATTQLFVVENNQQLPIYYIEHSQYSSYGWIKALWRQAYGTRSMPPTTSSPDDSVQFRKDWGGTIFLTPLLETGARVRSYGYNKYLCRYTGNDPTSGTLSPMRYNEIINPSRTALIGDSQKSIQLHIDSNSTGRNDGYVLIVFADGHVEGLKPPDPNTENPLPSECRMPYNRNSTFWRGTDAAPDGRTITIW